jgi:hypothetical protein
MSEIANLMCGAVAWCPVASIESSGLGVRLVPEHKHKAGSHGPSIRKEWRTSYCWLAGLNERFSSVREPYSKGRCLPEVSDRTSALTLMKKLLNAKPGTARCFTSALA